MLQKDEMLYAFAPCPTPRILVVKIFSECAREAVRSVCVCSKIQRRLNKFQLYYEEPPIVTAHEVGAHINGLRIYFFDDLPGDFDQRNLWHNADDISAVFFLYAKVSPSSGDLRMA